MDFTFLDRLFVANGLWSFSIIGSAFLLGTLAYVLLRWGAERMLRHAGEGRSLEKALVRHLRGPMRLLLPLLVVYVALPVARPHMAAPAALFVDTGMQIVLVIAVAWLLIAGFQAGEDAVALHYEMNVSDNLQARKIVTQVRILRRIATVIVVVLAVGLVLMQYEPFRRIGTGILASAGIVGIVIGVAAQQTLSDLIAGIQIALTQPIRVDDVVIVEGDFGWVEEITLTYVVVRIWDRRRIVLPITHFVEKPFQNWTRTSSDLIGSVFLHVDYRTPVEAVREELRRIVEASEYWDGDVCALHVTDTSDRTIQLRALASAPDAPDLWELRCEIREALIAYLRDQHPEALPVVRAQMQTDEMPPFESDPAPAEQ